MPFGRDAHSLVEIAELLPQWAIKQLLVAKPTTRVRGIAKLLFAKTRHKNLSLDVAVYALDRQ